FYIARGSVKGIGPRCTAPRHVGDRSCPTSVFTPARAAEVAAMTWRPPCPASRRTPLAFTLAWSAWRPGGRSRPYTEATQRVVAKPAFTMDTQRFVVHLFLPAKQGKHQGRNMTTAVLPERGRHFASVDRNGA